eukprot:jgi/Mesvir1/8928/Mv16075-RA.2
MTANMRKLLLLAMFLLVIATITFAALPPADAESCRMWWLLVALLYLFLAAGHLFTRWLARSVRQEEFGRREYRLLLAFPAVLCLVMGAGVILLRNVEADIYLPLTSDLALALLVLTFCHHLVSQTAARLLVIFAGFFALNLTVLIHEATKGNLDSDEGTPVHAMDKERFLPHSAFLNLILALYSLTLLGAGYSREWDDRRSFVLMNQVSASKVRSEALLENMLPRSILRALEGGRTLISEEFEEVSIMFIYIDGFNAYTASTPPKKLITFLNDVFSAIDKLVESREVYKIETVGDVYMVGGGVPDPCDDHAERVGLLALDLMKLEARWETCEKTGNLPLRLRIGVHCGPVVAGVIGLKRLHYRVFGDTVNVASRMGSHGCVGKVHCSDLFQQQLVNEGFVFEARGEIMVKGKGMTHTYYLLSGPPGWDNSLHQGRHSRGRTAMDGRFWREGGSTSAENSRHSHPSSSIAGHEHQGASWDGSQSQEVGSSSLELGGHLATAGIRQRERSVTGRQTWAGDSEDGGGPGAHFTSGLLSRCKSGENGIVLLQAPVDMYGDEEQLHEEEGDSNNDLKTLRTSFEHDSASIGSHLRRVGFDMGKLETVAKPPLLGALPLPRHHSRRRTMPVEILPAMTSALGERELRRASQHHVLDHGDESSSPTGSFSEGHGSFKRRQPLGKTRLKVLRAVAVAPAPLMALPKDEVEAMYAAAMSPRHSHLDGSDPYDTILQRAARMGRQCRTSADSLLHGSTGPMSDTGVPSSFQCDRGSPPQTGSTSIMITHRSGSLSPMKRLPGSRNQLSMRKQARSPSLDASLAARHALGGPAPPSHFFTGGSSGLSQGGLGTGGDRLGSGDSTHALLELINKGQSSEYGSPNKTGAAMGAASMGGGGQVPRRASIHETTCTTDGATLVERVSELRRNSMSSLPLVDTGSPGFGRGELGGAVPAATGGIAGGSGGGGASTDGILSAMRHLRSGSWNGALAQGGEPLAPGKRGDDAGGTLLYASASSPFLKTVERFKGLELKSGSLKGRPSSGSMPTGSARVGREMVLGKQASLGSGDAAAAASMANAGSGSQHGGAGNSGGGAHGGSGDRVPGKPPRSRASLGPDSPNLAIGFLSPDRWWQSPAKGSPHVPSAIGGLHRLTSSFAVSPMFAGDRKHADRAPSISGRKAVSSINSSMGEREREDGNSYHADRLQERGLSAHAIDAGSLFSEAALSAFLDQGSCHRGGADSDIGQKGGEGDDGSIRDDDEIGLHGFDPHNGGAVSLMKPVTLTFWLHPNWEKRYRREAVSLALTKVRLVYSAVLFLLLIYTGFDIYQHRDFKYTFWSYVLRVSYGMAVAVALFLVRGNSAMLYEATTVCAAIGGIVVVAVSYELTGFDPISESTVSTVILSLPATMLVMGLRFTTASATGLLILLLYYGQLLVTIAILGDKEGRDFETAPIIMLCIYLLLQWVLLMSSCHSTELERRRKFLVDEEIRQQKVFTNRILCNLMPPLVANQLRRGERHIVDSYSEASVLYADIVGFTPLSAMLGPLKLVVFLNRLFSDFDIMCDKHSITKINTIGDCYTCMAGVPLPDPDHCMAVVEMGLSMLLALDALQEELTSVFEGLPHVDMRVGVHTVRAGTSRYRGEAESIVLQRSRAGALCGRYSLANMCAKGQRHSRPSVQ